jgi:hypothetical protein
VTVPDWAKAVPNESAAGREDRRSMSVWHSQRSSAALPVERIVRQPVNRPAASISKP